MFIYTCTDFLDFLPESLLLRPRGFKLNRDILQTPPGTPVCRLETKSRVTHPKCQPQHTAPLLFKQNLFREMEKCRKPICGRKKYGRETCLWKKIIFCNPQFSKSFRVVRENPGKRHNFMGGPIVPVAKTFNRGKQGER